MIVKTATQGIDITGVDKADILAALFNASQPVGLGILQAHKGPFFMTKEQARELLDGTARSTDYPVIDNGPNTGGDFDYLYGRPLKINLKEDVIDFNPRGFDRNNGGDGTAARIIAGLPRE